MTEGWWIALCAVTAVLVLAALVPLRIDVALAADALTRRWRVRLAVGTAWGPPRWRRRLRSRPPGRGRSPGAWRGDAGDGGTGHGSALSAIGHVWRVVRVHRARLRVELGAPDAALTAVGCGAVQALGGSLLASLPGLAPDRARLCVLPRYGGPGRLACRVVVEARLRLWQAAVVALELRRR